MNERKSKKVCVIYCIQNISPHSSHFDHNQGGKGGKSEKEDLPEGRPPDYDAYESACKKTTEYVKRSLDSISVSKASPNLIAKINVNANGRDSPLDTLSQITARGRDEDERERKMNHPFHHRFKNTHRPRHCFIECASSCHSD